MQDPATEIVTDRCYRCAQPRLADKAHAAAVAGGGIAVMRAKRDAEYAQYAAIYERERAALVGACRILRAEQGLSAPPPSYWLQ